MTLTQLGAFVLVARLGSVRDAARALGVSEPAVSQALHALRSQLGDPLVSREGGRMNLTPAGARLLPIASQMVALGAEAEAAVRAARGRPGLLRVAATSTIAEFVTTPLLAAFDRRSALPIEGSAGVAACSEMPVLLHNRLTDLTLGPYLGDDPELASEPVFRTRLIAVGAPNTATAGATWLADPSATDPRSDTSELLRRLKVPEERIRVYPGQTAAWTAAAASAGIAVVLAHLVTHQVKRGELAVIPTAATPAETRWHATTLAADDRPVPAAAFRRFLATPEAVYLMRTPTLGVPPSRFRPPVYVTIWS